MNWLNDGFYIFPGVVVVVVVGFLMFFEVFVWLGSVWLDFFSVLCAFGPEAPWVVRFQWQGTCCGSGTGSQQPWAARGSIPAVPPAPVPWNAGWHLPA